MQTEAECPPNARYLYADERYSDDALQVRQADCVRRYQNRAKDAAYYAFTQWQRRANEVAVFTWNAYADLALPKQFNCIFSLDNPREYVLTDYKLTQAILSMGGEWPVDHLVHGHKHICVLVFAQEVPTVLQKLYQSAGQLTAGPPLSAFKLGFCQAADLPAILAERERVAQLRARHGAHWWQHDELSA